MDPNGPIARRFPLIARFRPACLPLPQRVQTLTALADQSEQDNDQGAASSVHNQAALLASDVGLPDLAREMCHAHAHAYLQACPLPAMSAIRGLEPLVNLARLKTRAGRADAGRGALTALFEAVTNAASLEYDGLTVPKDLVATAQDRQEVRTWLWRVLLADGTRTLTAAGRWSEAETHIAQHRGVGQRMLDGRQVAIVAALVEGDHERASRLLAETAPGDPWERNVTLSLATANKIEEGDSTRRRPRHLDDRIPQDRARAGPDGLRDTPRPDRFRPRPPRGPSGRRPSPRTRLPDGRSGRRPRRTRTPHPRAMSAPLQRTPEGTLPRTRGRMRARDTSPPRDRAQ